MTHFLISTLAEYQTRFWLEVGVQLRQRGYSCAFISFDDRSTEMLNKAGFKTYSLRDLPQEHPSHEVILGTFDEHGISAPERWFLHERMAYGEQNQTTLVNKLYNAIRLGQLAIAKSKSAHGDVSLIQEVGGFLSVVGCFAAAQNAKVPNWFIEPAFFKGRLFFTRDSFAAPSISSAHASESLDDVKAYIENALKTQQIVIPEKDRHHYSSATKKILNKHNLVRLIQKSFDKYILGKKQEFGYLGKQVGSHLRMLWNSARLRNKYTPLAALDRFIYFPLHVPGDMALTIRSPEYVDQFTLLEMVLRASPPSHSVTVKEHPAMIGALNADRFLGLLKRYPQFKIINPSTNNYDVLRRADLVVSINSKSGAEAALLGKPVLVMGEAFYSNSTLIKRLDSPRQLEQAISATLSGGQSPDLMKVMDYFHDVWDSSHPGELYVVSPDKVFAFTNSLICATQSAVSESQQAARKYV